MIQFKRGKTRHWFEKLGKMEPLAPGQPGYDSERNKLKIGDGKHSWAELPYTGGLDKDEILSPEKEAKNRFSLFDKAISGLKNLLGIKLDFGNDKVAIFTYGKERPDEHTVGQVYLQQYDTEPETDYVVEISNSGIWDYRKWWSGRFECWGTYTLETTMSEAISGVALFTNNTSLPVMDYPFTLLDAPVETVSVASNSEFVWMVSKTLNTNEHTAKYNLLSCIENQKQVAFSISYHVLGRWR